MKYQAPARFVLWFGDDMFCQMNMLTVLAYLDQSGYKGEVYVHMVREANGDIEAAEAVEISPEGYHEVYQQVLIHHRFPDAPGLPVMRSAIERYIEYRKEDNEITAYLKRNIDQPSDELLRNLFREFPQYGLGDVQYYKIIEKVKRSWRTRNVK